MADKNLLEQMLSHLVNDDKQKAEELFHEYVVAKSREIYESLIEDDIVEAEDEEAEDEEELDEASAASEEDEEEMDEGFEDIAIEGDDEEAPDFGGDATDDLAGELGGEEGEGGDDLADKEPEELFQDLDAIVDELQSKFDAMNGGGEEMGGDDEAEEGFELATVREYVEKVPAGHGAEKKGAAEKAESTKSVIDNMKNDMGGTTANILSGKEDSGSKGTAGGLANNKPQDMNTGNINVPGGKAGGAFNKKEPGHGAEKKGAAEKGADTTSLFRGRR